MIVSGNKEFIIGKEISLIIGNNTNATVNNSTLT
jgi:hypothetical protein